MHCFSLVSLLLAADVGDTPMCPIFDVIDIVSLQSSASTANINSINLYELGKSVIVQSLSIHIYREY
ncbi:hypothetical protein FJSC11DRAFT_0698 [Fischerella thermalis JSC-11]|jgi:hypothetical protein|uniref:Uncharacterized protein n=1 Tax=Fischerella thermalis JSC-11 TaxID=741277 RepID=G6FPB8_9CYAN|nr:hypothetical protein FJSC11DRAFT_0698 [Fischerella thermalis JSC-11]